MKILQVKNASHDFVISHLFPYKDDAKLTMKSAKVDSTFDDILKVL
jgi:hypothetical protein